MVVVSQPFAHTLLRAFQALRLELHCSLEGLGLTAMAARQVVVRDRSLYGLPEQHDELRRYGEVALDALGRWPVSEHIRAGLARYLPRPGEGEVRPVLANATVVDVISFCRAGITSG